MLVGDTPLSEPIATHQKKYPSEALSFLCQVVSILQYSSSRLVSFIVCCGLNKHRNENKPEFRV